MQRKLLGIALVCVVLLVAIVAGYWDMLQSERLRISAPPETLAGTGIAGVPQTTVLEDAVPRPSDGQRADASSTGAENVPSADGAETARASLDQDDSPVRAPAADGVVPPAMTPPAEADPQGASASEGRAAVAASAGEDMPAAAGAGPASSSNDKAVAAIEPDLGGEAASADTAANRQTAAEGATPARRPERDMTVEAPLGGEAPVTGSGQGEQASRELDDMAVPAAPSPESAEAAPADHASGGQAAPADRASSQAASPDEAARRSQTAARTGTRPDPVVDAPAAGGVAAADGADTGETTRDPQAAAQAPDRARVTPREPLASETAQTSPAEAETDDPAEASRPAQTAAPAETPGPVPSTEDVASRTAPEAGGRDSDQGAGETMPRFDLLRVEPDGATVIAGRAAPGSRIALRDGDATVGTDTANASGEFAIALENLLEPGDHAIRIVATAEDGSVAVSEETAIVSVPQPGRESELLAMVEAPNEPSRLISIPGDAPGADGAAAAPPPTASPSGAPDSTGAASDGSASAGTSARLDIAREDGSESAPDAGTDTVTLPRAEAEARESAAAPSSVPMLRVEAVEIEAGQVYVAGAAEAGSLVRVYIDNVLLAEDRATPAGRFLVNADATVAPGDHVVRADQVARDGSVSGRAEVPFQRPEGPSVAMVAPRPDLGTGRDGADERTASGEAAATRDDGPAGQEPPPASAASAAAPASETAGEDETEIVADETADDAAASANGASAAPEPPPASAAPAAAPASGLAVGDDPEIVAQDPADDLPAEASGDVASAPATDAAAGDRSPADATGDELATRGPSDAPDAGAGLNAAAGRPAGTEALATSGAGTAPAEGQVPASPEAGEAGIPADPSAVAAASESVPVTRQEALTTAPGRVIIRRGDTLWRISRENYGFGSRYVVIYLANGDQIRDPDLIYPGQVFSVPEERVDTSDAGGAG